MLRRVVPILSLLMACSGSEVSDSGGQDASGQQTDDGGTTGDADATGTTTGVTSGAPATTTSAGVETTSEPGTGSDAGSSEGSTGGELEPPQSPTMLPTPTGTCPTLVEGDVMFAPAGIAPRMVKLWLSDEAKVTPGPLVFYWHGTGSAPQEAAYGLGPDYVKQVVAQGGVIAAPYHDPEAGDFPWWLVLGSREDDLILADEVLACALEQFAVDVTHIHTAGMSAGGLQTAQMSIRRSGYIASAVPYSGGIITPPPDQEPNNPLSAMIFHGGPDDVVIIKFEQTSEMYKTSIEGRGGFAFLCDHGMGHSIPQGAAQESVWRFFLDHPYGTKPSPYVSGLPSGFPDYCALP